MIIFVTDPAILAVRVFVAAALVVGSALGVLVLEAHSVIFAAWLAVISIAEEASVVMRRRHVARSIVSIAELVRVFAARVWGRRWWLSRRLEVALVVGVTDVTSLAVGVLVAAALVVSTTFGVFGFDADTVIRATWLTVVAIAVEASVMMWRGDVTGYVEALAVGVGAIAALDGFAPMAVVTEVSIRAMLVLQALGRAPFVIYAGLPGFAVTGARYIGAVTFVHCGPYTRGTLGPLVKPVIKGECPLEATAIICRITQLVAILYAVILVATHGAFEETGFKLRSTLPETAAVSRMLMVVWLLEDGVNELATVRDPAAIVRQALLPGVDVGVPGGAQVGELSDLLHAERGGEVPRHEGHHSQ